MTTIDFLLSLQIIKNASGKPEYVLLPIEAYEALKPQMNRMLSGEYESFNLENYVSNPVALIRAKANLTQGQLAELLGVTQAYISNLESKDEVSPKFLERVSNALEDEKLFQISKKRLNDGYEPIEVDLDGR